MKIVDDFLDQDDFYELQTFMVEPEPALPWYYNSIIDSADDVDKFQFTHLFYTDWVPISSSMKILNPILIKIDPIKLWRIKANLLTRTSNIVENEFHQDAGEHENYTQCSWQTEGKGQFIPIHDAKPVIGEIDQIEIVTEVKVEMMCHKDIIKNVVNSMKNSHPYESVAYTVIKMEEI